MELANVITIISVIIAIVVSVGGVAAFFRSSTGSNIIKLQGIEIESLRRTKSDDDKTIATLTEANNAKDQTILEIKKHNSYLQKLAQGSPQLKKLSDIIANNTTTVNNLAKIVSGYMEDKK